MTQNTSTIYTERTSLKNIIPNPFKKDIDKGHINEERVLMLMEGYKQTSFHENLLARPSKKEAGKYELVYGHHRTEAARRLYGPNHVISLHVIDYSDEQMLIDLCRENLTQGRYGDFQHEHDSVLLTKKWLEQKMSVNRVDSHSKRPKTGPASKVGAREIAKFLSKEGRTMSHEKVAQHLSIEENLSPELKEQIVKKKATEQKDKLGFKEAVQLSKIKDHEKQKETLEVMKAVKKDEKGRTSELMNAYISAPAEVQQQIASGELTVEQYKKTKEKPAMNSEEMNLQLQKKSLALINEMRLLRTTLNQFCKEKLYAQFSKSQRNNFKERLVTLKTEYATLVEAIEKSMEELT